MKWFAILLLVKTVFSSSPEENQGSNNTDLFEGDMIFTPQQRYRAEHGLDVDSDRKRASIRDRSKLWPNREVIYVIDPVLASFPDAMKAINDGMNEWIAKTCIRFKRRTTETAYAYFQLGSGCSSFVGRIGSVQPINLGAGCWSKGVVAHEIGHAVGFYHEQSRPDRDKYVIILWENIQNDAKGNFSKYDRSTIDSLGTPYDYESLMHYGDDFFTKNGRPTIVVKQKGAKIGQRNGLSPIDAEQANLLYGCQSDVDGIRIIYEIRFFKAPAPVPAQSGCSSYQLLTESDREKGPRLSPSVRPKCDSSLKKGWYRFSGAAGNQMPTKAVPTNHCGTHAPGWLRVRHPTVRQGAVRRTVCFHWSGNQCRWSSVIRVQNCGAFFVYELKPTPACNLRYCGQKGMGSSTGAAVCRDLYFFCGVLKRYNFCKRSSRVRSYLCRRSCGTC